MREIWKIVKSNVQAKISDMDKTCVRTNRELVYGAIACSAVGMVVGLLFSPKKVVTIGSNNGNNNAGTAKLNASTDEQDEDEE